MRSDRFARRRLAAGVLVGIVAVGAGCGGSGSEKGTPSSGVTTTSLKSSDRPFPTQSTAPSIAGDNSVSAGELDVSSVPPFVVALSRSLISAADGKTQSTLEDEAGLKGVLSPDGKHYAVAKRADAVRAAGLDIIATDTGRSERSFDIDTTNLNIYSWSPDSSAVLVQGTGAQGEQTWGVYRVDGSTDDVPLNHKPQSSRDTKWAIGPDGATWSECTSFSGQCYPGFQLTTTKHAPVFLAYKQDTKVFGRFDGAKGALVPLAGAGATATGAVACGRYALLYRRGATSGQEVFAVYDSDTGKVNVVPNTANGCPVVSRSGTKMALPTKSAPIAVDVATGKSTQIAREGKPVAWSEDGSQVLVQASSGTFRVAGDGSGGKEASVRMVKVCVVGTTGKVLGSAIGGGIVLYDIDADSATKVGTSAFAQTCTVTDDGKWAYTVGQVYDIEGARGGPLEVRVDGDKQAPGKFSWRTAATVVDVVSY